MKARPLLLLAVLALVAATPSMGCGRYRPALFADCPVVTLAGDDRPIPVPTRRSYDEREQISEIYLRRPLFDVVHPSDFVVAGDVNAMDEVPPSSWYEPRPLSGDGATPPQLPFVAVDEDPVIHDDALVVHDARGLRYELIGDPPAQPGLRTGAEVLGGYLLRGVGLRAPSAYLVTLPKDALGGPGEIAARVAKWRARMGGTRVSATRWPIGIDVGSPSDYSVRRDDPNDAIDHSDRRTLRALKTFAHWIDWGDFGVRRTRDVYVGKPGAGHVVHYLVGTSDAFGTNAAHDGPLRQELAGGFWWNLATLGLSPLTVVPPAPAPVPSLGFFPPTLTAGDFTVSPPYSPFVRIRPGDEYWAAKRLLDAGERALVDGLVAAQYPPDAAKTLGEALRSRRRLLVAHGLSVVTPLDPLATVGRALWVRDRSISAGFANASATEYEIELLDTDGIALSPAVRQQAKGPVTEIVVPAGITGVVVLHVRVVRSGVAAPRWCDLHLNADASSVTLVGVRH